MPADEHSRWPHLPGGVGMRSQRGRYTGPHMRDRQRRLAAELCGVPARAVATVMRGDACDRTHLRVYADAVKPYDQAHAVVHVIARLVVAPPFTGMRTVYVTRCGRALPVGESARCARPVTCTDPRCAAQDARKPGARACNPGAGRS